MQRDAMRVRHGILGQEASEDSVSHGCVVSCSEFEEMNKKGQKSKQAGFQLDPLGSSSGRW